LKIPTQEEVARVEERYKGKRIELIEMPSDPSPIEPGTKGTVEMVDGLGQLILKWDNGRTLSLIPGVDKFKIVEERTLPFTLACTEENPCCDRRGEYNGYGSGPLKFVCPKHCSCHD